MNVDIAALTEKAARAVCLRLFLDYDGTLAEFAPTPDIIQPRADLIDLLKRLAAAPGVLPAVISGRRLADIEKLLPAAGLLLGGAYGLEMLLPDGSRRTILSADVIRPQVEKVKTRWQDVIAGSSGFILEDKGWTVALHGRHAGAAQVSGVMERARLAASDSLRGEKFRLLGGDRFLEFAPLEASKSAAVRWVLDSLTPPDAMVVFLGDDDKDEEAFEAILEAGGTAVRVAAEPVSSLAQYRLSGPRQVRSWLEDLLAKRAG